MKKTTLTLLAAAAALGLSACDQAKEATAEAKEAAVAAEAKAKAVAEAAAAKAGSATDKLEAALPGIKAKAADAMAKAKTAGSEALDKSKVMADAAADWTKAKLGIPEADGMLEGFHALFAEAKEAVNTGMNSEKASVLKGKWDTLYAKSAETMKNLGPETEAKLKPILDTIKAKWDELLEKSKGGTVQ